MYIPSNVYSQVDNKVEHHIFLVYSWLSRVTLTVSAPVYLDATRLSP
jgi:hypothetical protein